MQFTLLKLNPLLVSLLLVGLLFGCSTSKPVIDQNVSILDESLGEKSKESPIPIDPEEVSLRVTEKLAELYGTEASKQLHSASWGNLPGWDADQLEDSLPALIQSCLKLNRHAQWIKLCDSAKALESSDTQSIRALFEHHFLPFLIVNTDGSTTGKVTGYYEPLLKGSLTKTKEYKYPVYAAPDDLITVDTKRHPEFEKYRGSGRRVGKLIKPYYTRSEIDAGLASLKDKELLWVNDKVELFFLQIQGSGRIQLEDGDIVRLGYAKSNGHPYRSIGRILVSRGELTLSEASMQRIKEWGQENPSEIDALLAENPSYVFFRKLPNHLNGPIGSLGVPLTPKRSVAVDNRFIPSGFPLFLSTTWPNSSLPLNRLVLAQDKGTAITGAVRADFFWGFGADAGLQAGKMKQPGTMWLLLPKTFLNN